jgi:hypothetical protein
MSEQREAFGRLTKALAKMVTAYRDFGRQMALAWVRSPKIQRQMKRDWARQDRRPALIHKGGKP